MSAVNPPNRLLSERRNRHAWLAPYVLFTVGVSLLLAGLGVDLWWLPCMLLLATRPVRRRR